MGNQGSRYEIIISEIFRRRYRKGAKVFEFARAEIETVADKLGIKLPKNIGDLLYYFRFRKIFSTERRQAMNGSLSLRGRRNTGSAS